MTLPSFKVNSKPTLSQQEFDANKKTGGGNFLSEPGTYDMTIKSVAFSDAPSEKDTAWINCTVTLATPDDKTLKHFVMVPVECRNSYLFGADKGTFALEGLQKFFRGLGIVFDYDNGMSQVAALFGNPDKLIGKTIKVRLGYKGIHTKYVAKEQYVVVDRDHTTQKVDGVFANVDAARAAAADAGFKGVVKNNDFINVLEIFPSAEPLVSLTTEPTVEIDLPF